MVTNLNTQKWSPLDHGTGHFWLDTALVSLFYCQCSTGYKILKDANTSTGVCVHNHTYIHM